MSKLSSKQQAVLDILVADFELLILNETKKLLETKHLYQSVRVNYNDLIKECKEQNQVDQDIVDEFESYIFDEWFVENQNISRKIVNPREMIVPRINYYIPDAKLYCKSCKRKEPFNIVFADDILQPNVLISPIDGSEHVFQVFVISLLCQSCKSIPEVFIIRREEMKLTICGRAPIEEVEVPSVIPKTVGKFYSDAIVAYQSGQILAGNFLLRTLIEQWGQEKIHEPKLKADEIIDKYMESLPPDFKDRFKSMREIYGKLSDDIHKAIGSPELFEEAKDAIVEHFDARRLFGLK